MKNDGLEFHHYGYDFRDGTHPVTGILYDDSALPDFSPVMVFETCLPLADFRTDDPDHGRLVATRALKRAIEQGEVASGIFNRRQQADIEGERTKIEGLSWYFHLEYRRMQLVPDWAFRLTPHWDAIIAWRGD